MRISERLFAGTFGVFLLGVGIYAAASAATPAVWRYLGGAVICALGANAVYGAITGRRPWISRIGPFP